MKPIWILWEEITLDYSKKQNILWNWSNKILTNLVSKSDNNGSSTLTFAYHSLDVKYLFLFVQIEALSDLKDLVLNSVFWVADKSWHFWSSKKQWAHFMVYIENNQILRRQYLYYTINKYLFYWKFDLANGPEFT